MCGWSQTHADFDAALDAPLAQRPAAARELASCLGVQSVFGRSLPRWYSRVRGETVAGLLWRPRSSGQGDPYTNTLPCQSASLR